MGGRVGGSDRTHCGTVQCGMLGKQHVCGRSHTDHTDRANTRWCVAEASRTLDGSQALILQPSRLQR